MPEWLDLTPTIRLAWIEAAKAIWETREELTFVSANPLPEKRDKPVFVGRSVYYVHPIMPVVLLATVVCLHPDGAVNLEIHPDGETLKGHSYIEVRVPHDSQKLPGTWHHLPQF